jgi:hypothetical protein
MPTTPNINIVIPAINLDLIKIPTTPGQTIPFNGKYPTSYSSTYTYSDNFIYKQSTNKLVSEADFQNIEKNQAGSTYTSRYDILQNRGNAKLGSVLSQLGRSALSGLASGFGTGLTQQFAQPQINRIPVPVTSNIFRIQGDGAGQTENMNQPYETVPISRIDELAKWSITKYKDFRSFKGLVFSPNSVRLDGAGAATRNIGNFDVQGSAVSIAYAGASIVPGGAYTIFNLESTYGFGTHGDPNVLRKDFTVGTQVRTYWKENPDFKGGKWVTTKNPAELATEFRGDKVNVIDFSQRKLKDVYNWKAPWGDATNAFNRFLGATDLTKDFIKFFFTGPKLNAGNVDDEDDIIAFRAILDTLSDNHNPNWQAVSMIGRADPNYTYTGYTRDVNLGFTVYATSRDEMKPIWRKLNALAGYTTPDYGSKTIALKGPWMRITIGDLFYQQPAIITSLSYTMNDADTTWEINIEDDPTMMQLPHKVTVQMSFNLLTDSLPEKGGRFYSLAKKYTGATGVPKRGGHNWLSDFGTTDVDDAIYRRASVNENSNVTVETDVPSSITQNTTNTSNITNNDITQFDMEDPYQFL